MAWNRFAKRTPPGERTEAQKRGASNRRRGVAFEGRVRRELRRALFYVVRAAGSRGAVDLVGIRADLDLFVQVKRDRKGFPRVEWEEVRRLANDHGAIPVLASADGRSVRYEVLDSEWAGTFRPEGKVFDPRRLQSADDLVGNYVWKRLVDRDGETVTRVLEVLFDGSAVEQTFEGRAFDLEGRLGDREYPPVVVFRERRPARRKSNAAA